MTAPLDATSPTDNVLDAYSARKRILLLGGTLACIAINVAGSAVLHVPVGREYSASLFQQPHAWIAFVATVGLFMLSVAVGSLIARSVHSEAGLFCAAAGLAAISARGGPMRFALFAANGPGIFLMLAMELAILSLMILVGWMVMVRFLAGGRVQLESGEESVGQKLQAVVMQVLLMSLLIMLLAQSDDKAQALASVGLAALLATIGAQWFSPVNSASWMLAGPLIVGMLGYCLTYLNPAGIEIGRLRGTLAPLARPVPIDYASLGVAGALMGYWNTAKWRRALPGTRSAGD